MEQKSKVLQRQSREQSRTVMAKCRITMIGLQWISVDERGTARTRKAKAKHRFELQKSGDAWRTNDLISKGEPQSIRAKAMKCEATNSIEYQEILLKLLRFLDIRIA